MRVIEVLWIISQLLCCCSVLGMLYVYKALDNSLTTHLRFLIEIRQDLMDLRIKQLGREHGTAIPSMAEDTKMGE